MPETRYHRSENYRSSEEGGGLINIEEIPYEVSDEEFYQEQLEAEFNHAHEQAILALKNWGSLTLSQKDTILKNLLKWALWKDEWLTLGIL